MHLFFSRAAEGWVSVLEKIDSIHESCWAGVPRSAAGEQEHLRRSLFPRNIRTPNTTKPPNQPFLFLWQLEVLKNPGVSADAGGITAAQTAAELSSGLYMRVDVDLRGLRGTQSCPTESYGPLDRPYNQYTPHHPPDPSLTYMSDSSFSVFHLSSWSGCL